MKEVDRYKKVLTVKTWRVFENPTGTFDLYLYRLTKQEYDAFRELLTLNEQPPEKDNAKDSL